MGSKAPEAMIAGHRWNSSALMKAAWVTVFLIALGLRLSVVAGVVGPPTSDARGYHLRAISLLEGRGYADAAGPTAYKPPLQSIFLAGVYRARGVVDVQAARYAQAVLGAVMCMLVGLLGIRVWGSVVGWWAALLAALNPALVCSARRLLSEGLFTFWLLAACVLAVVWWQSERRGWAVGSGICLGLATLTRSVACFLPVWWCGWALIMWWRGSDQARRCFRGALCALVGTAIVLMPWVARNWLVFGEFIPTATYGGVVMYSSYHPAEGKIYGVHPQDEVMATAATLGSETASSRYLLSTLRDQIRRDPGLLVRYIPLKLAYFFSPFDWEIVGGGRYNPVYALSLPLALLGLVFLWSSRRWAAMGIGFLFLYFLGMAIVAYGSPRFRMPLEPYLGLLAAIAIVEWWRRSARRVVPMVVLSVLTASNALMAMGSGTVYGVTREWLVARGWW